MSDEFVENMEEYFGVRMDMDGFRIGNEHLSESENQRTEFENHYQGPDDEVRERLDIFKPTLTKPFAATYDQPTKITTYPLDRTRVRRKVVHLTLDQRHVKGFALYTTRSENRNPDLVIESASTYPLVHAQSQWLMWINQINIFDTCS
ncbi:Hypothetical predicted protein [Octopus vulgaris]|uniref:Uncharacterized protein n=1 Tax=Octopus vulgaris TaxID=6645 RepID=A0AA36BNH8_OCTVU|nr:Hypothetical predicted protein [Octopus vulgaris]